VNIYFYFFVYIKIFWASTRVVQNYSTRTRVELLRHSTSVIVNRPHQLPTHPVTASLTIFPAAYSSSLLKIIRWLFPRH